MLFLKIVTTALFINFSFAKVDIPIHFHKFFFLKVYTLFNLLIISMIFPLLYKFR